MASLALNGTSNSGQTWAAFSAARSLLAARSPQAAGAAPPESVGSAPGSAPAGEDLSIKAVEKAEKRAGIRECTTCAERTYKDGSDDPGVSFKTATHVSAAESASAVASHEQEHVRREQSGARAEGREVVAQSVNIVSAICPECGRSYVAGGTTRTVTKGATPTNKSEKGVDIQA